MARQKSIPDPKAAKRDSQCMKNLRLTMGLPRSQFAALVGLVGARLINREAGVSPWRPAEINQVKIKVAEYLKTVEQALATLDA